MMQPSEGKKLHGMLDDARRLVSCRREVPILEKSLAKTDNPQKRARLAECHALLGDWKRAIDEFTKMDGKVGRVAKCEKDSSGAMTSAEVADFWWTYPGAKDRNGITAFQRHAVAWYGVALKDGSLTGLKRNLAEKRIADVQATVGAADAPVLPESVQMLKEGDGFRIIYEPEKLPTAELLSLLQQAGPIREMTVQPQNIDHLIADMYREMGL